MRVTESRSFVYTSNGQCVTVLEAVAAGIDFKKEELSMVEGGTHQKALVSCHFLAQHKHKHLVI